MFPILNKYIANELRNSKYCSESFKNEVSPVNEANSKKKPNVNVNRRERDRKN